MAIRRFHVILPSDPDFLLHYIDEIAEESGSDEEFDGYLGPEDSPVTYLSSHNLDFQDNGNTPLTRSRSIDSLAELQHEQPLHTESPLPYVSLSPSPMYGEHASGSPLAASPTHSYTDSVCQVKIKINYSKTSAFHQCSPLYSVHLKVSTLTWEKVHQSALLWWPSAQTHLLWDNSVCEPVPAVGKRTPANTPTSKGAWVEKSPLTVREMEAFLALLIGRGNCGFPTLRYM